MPDLEPITRDEKLWSGEDLEPITRREMYIKHLYDETQVIPDKPITREEMFILKAGEELHDVTIEQLTATENKTYSEEGVAYSPVIVNVPQTTLTTLDVTENGTYTAPSGTAYSEVDVDVPLPENAYLLKEIENVEIATFTDGSDLPMPKLEVAVEPQQDLHGYDSPWVGGAGKNKCKPISGTTTEKGITITPQSDGSIILNGTKTTDDSGIRITGSYATVANQTQIASIVGVSPLPTGIEDFGFIGYGKNSFITPSSSYSDSGIQVFINQGTTLANVRLYPQIEMGSSRTSYEPYSNECPISGWSAVDVNVSGKNKLENSAVSSTSSGVSYTVNSDTTISCSGTATATSYLTIAQNYSLKAGTYILNGCPVGGGMETMRMSLTRPGANVAFDTGSGAEFTLDSDVNDLTLNIRIGSGQNVSGKVFKPMIRLASETDATFEPYNPNSETITIPFKDSQGNPIEVYGGECDVVNGTSGNKNTWKYYNISDITFGEVGNYYRFVNNSIPYAKDQNSSSGMLSHFTYGESADCIVGITPSSGKYILFYKDKIDAKLGISSVAEFNAYLQAQKTNGTPVQLIYKLANSEITTFYTQPTQVSSLMGVNNIWADCGKIIDGQYFSKGE